MKTNQMRTYQYILYIIYLYYRSFHCKTILNILLGNKSEKKKQKKKHVYDIGPCKTKLISF